MDAVFPRALENYFPASLPPPANLRLGDHSLSLLFCSRTLLRYSSSGCCCCCCCQVGDRVSMFSVSEAFRTRWNAPEEEELGGSGGAGGGGDCDPGWLSPRRQVSAM